MKDKIIYHLTSEDVQRVAEEQFGRKLTSREIEKLTDPIAENISWYDAIEDAIKDTLGLEVIDKS
jgi:hypothetical protein